MCAFCPQQKAFLTSAMVMGALFFLCSLILFLGVKEKQGESFRDSQCSNTINKSFFVLVEQLCRGDHVIMRIW